MGYNGTVLDHAQNPRNVGFIQGYDGRGESGDPRCGDMVVMTIRVRDGRLAEVKFLVRGCGAAMATCSMVTELATGRTLEQVAQLSDEDVAQALGGLPEPKMHCSNLAATALHRAIEDYWQRRKIDLHGRCVFCFIDACPICWYNTPAMENGRALHAEKR